MKNLVEITSFQNPRIKHLVKLRDRRHREAERKIIVEGFREVSRALERGLVFEEFYFSEAYFLGENEPALLQKIAEQGSLMHHVAEPIFPKICYRDRPEGLVGVLNFLDTTLEKISLSNQRTPLLVIVENIEKPGNLGTMLRTADAVGVDGLIVCDKCTDLFNPNVIRASTGAVFSVPIAETTSELAFAWLKKNQIKILAADPYAKQVYYQQNLKEPLAIVLGSEQFGLSEFWKKNADILVNIPMFGMADSLNVAQAGTILLFEARRQQNL